MSLGRIELTDSELEAVFETGEAQGDVTGLVAHAMLLAPLRLSISLHGGSEEQVALMHALPDVTVVQTPSADDASLLELIATPELLSRALAFTGLDPRTPAPGGEAMSLASTVENGGRGVAVSIAFEGVRTSTITEIAWLEGDGGLWALEDAEEPKVAHPSSGADLCERLLAALPS